MHFGQGHNFCEDIKWPFIPLELKKYNYKHDFFPIMKTAALRKVKFHVHFCLLIIINHVLV